MQNNKISINVSFQIQLLVTLGFVMLFVLNEDVQLYSRRNPQLMIIPMIGTLVLVCVMACSESARRSSPTNVILLGLFTFFESILVGFISSTYKPKIVSSFKTKFQMIFLK